MKNLITKDFLLQEYIINKKSTRQITKEFGISRATISKYLKKYNIKSRRNQKNILGNRYHKLVVIEKTNEKKFFSVVWICKCDCGNKIKACTRDLNSGNTKSCGCLHKESHWKGYEEITGVFWRSIKYCAKRRKIFFDITIQEAWDLFIKQDKKCALTGRNLVFRKSYKKTELQTASLDRIDSKIGYIKGNIQWIHKDINKMKQDLDEEYFLQLCKEIVNYNNKEFQETSME